MSAYAALRGLADGVFAPHNGEWLETHIFGFGASAQVQSLVYERDLVYVDFAAFVVHVSWFFVPPVLALILAVAHRDRLAECLGWMVVAAFLSDVFFVVAPTSPPWMHPGIHRVLVERSFVQYTGLDNNQFAALPSMHACMPMVLAFFFWFRGGRVRWMAALAGAYALIVGAAVIYLGEHWLVDVVAGYALAAVVAALFTSRRVRRIADFRPLCAVTMISAANSRLMRFGADPPTAEPLPLPIPAAAESEAA